jgi:hypothetical protein
MMIDDDDDDCCEKSVILLRLSTERQNVSCVVLLSVFLLLSTAHLSLEFAMFKSAHTENKKFANIEVRGSRRL